MEAIQIIPDLSHLLLLWSLPTHSGTLNEGPLGDL